MSNLLSSVIQQAEQSATKISSTSSASGAESLLGSVLTQVGPSSSITSGISKNTILNSVISSAEAKIVTQSSSLKSNIKLPTNLLDNAKFYTEILNKDYGTSLSPAQTVVAKSLGNLIMTNVNKSLAGVSTGNLTNIENTVLAATQGSVKGIFSNNSTVNNAISSAGISLNSVVGSQMKSLTGGTIANLPANTASLAKVQSQISSALAGGTSNVQISSALSSITKSLSSSLNTNMAPSIAANINKTSSFLSTQAVFNNNIATQASQAEQQLENLQAMATSEIEDLGSKLSSITSISSALSSVTSGLGNISF